MRIAVIGAGLIGAAAAKYLARAGYQVTLIGPDEPSTNDHAYQGPFASHYDEGRITRSLDASPFWAMAARQSISRYRDIEVESGVSFYNPVGILVAAPYSSETLSKIIQTAHDQNINAIKVTSEELVQRFPYFNFHSDDIGFWEPEDAGYISPRALVKAQIHLGIKAGLTRVKEPVSKISGKQVICPSFTKEFERILVTAGGYSQSLLDDDIGLSVYARTVAFFEVCALEAQRLNRQPSLIYYDAEGRDPYLLPAIRYPDGKFYLKLGGDRIDVKLSSQKEISDWFRLGGSPEVRDALAAHFRERMPNVEVLSLTKAACVTSFVESDLPLIRALTDSLFVATAGSGRAAKSSDELGRLASEQVQGNPLPWWADCD